MRGIVLNRASFVHALCNASMGAILKANWNDLDVEVSLLNPGFDRLFVPGHSFGNGPEPPAIETFVTIAPTDVRRLIEALRSLRTRRVIIAQEPCRPCTPALYNPEPRINLGTQTVVTLNQSSMTIWTPFGWDGALALHPRMVG